MIHISSVKEMQPMMGAEDFSFYQEEIPGYYYNLGMKNETKGKLAYLHSPHFEINEDALPFGAALQASLAARYIFENQPETTPLNQEHRDEL